MTWDPLPAFRCALLRDMQLLKEDDAKELTRVNGMWMRYRHEVTQAQTLPGQARRHFDAIIWPGPEWDHFSKLLTKRRQSRPEAREAKRAYSQKWYSERGRQMRSTPEAREKANRLRRERYAAKRARKPIQEDREDVGIDVTDSDDLLFFISV